MSHSISRWWRLGGNQRRERSHGTITTYRRLAAVAVGKGCSDVAHRAARLTMTDAGAVEDSPIVIMAKELDDLTLVVRAQEGDTRSFEALVRRHQHRFYRLAVRLLGNRSDAEDAVQDAFVAAWRWLTEFRGEAAFSSWMYRIVINRCLVLLRSRRRAIPVDDLGEQPCPYGASPEYTAESRNRATALQRALQDLPTDQRTCWILRELHELSYEDIASIVGASPDAVRGRLYRARRTLAEVMTPWR
jgi:RNA polymerase sigma-70 factor (ECF subfamily)